MTEEVDITIKHVLRCLRGAADPWRTPIGLIIRRDPHGQSIGDASGKGCGGYSVEFQFWYDIVWSPRVWRGVNLTKPSYIAYVQMNSAEFIALLIQLAAVV